MIIAIPTGRPLAFSRKGSDEPRWAPERDTTRTLICACADGPSAADASVRIWRSRIAGNSREFHEKLGEYTEAFLKSARVDGNAEAVGPLGALADGIALVNRLARRPLRNSQWR